MRAARVTGPRSDRIDAADDLKGMEVNGKVPHWPGARRGDDYFGDGLAECEHRPDGHGEDDGLAADGKCGEQAAGDVDLLFQECEDDVGQDRSWNRPPG